MISRCSIGRSTPSALRHQCHVQCPQRRNLAAAASGSFQYQTGDTAGVKFASRDLSGPTTTLAVVAKAGTRYQMLPGLADGLEKFAFKNTEKRSALRITREAELLGGELTAYHSRENLVIGARFLREDLPYFTELLGEVISLNRYTAHELHEEVIPSMELGRKNLLRTPTDFAINSAHGVAFHRGLGVPLHPASSTAVHKYVSEGSISAYASAAYAKPNFAVVANGAAHDELAKWVGEFFQDSPAAAPKDLPALESPATTYHGGEERIAHDGGNAMTLGFPGSSSFTAGSTYKPELAVLTALLGGESNIKWSSGFSLLSRAAEGHPGCRISTTHAPYSDAGLLYVTLQGSAQSIREASYNVVEAIKMVSNGEVSKEDITKAVASAKFKALEAGQNIDAGLELTGAGLVQGGKAYQMDEVAKGIDNVTPDQVKKAAKAILDGKASVSTVGDLFILPYAEEVGLKV